MKSLILPLDCEFGLNGDNMIVTMNSDQIDLRMTPVTGPAAFTALLMLVCLFMVIHGSGVPVMAAGCTRQAACERKDTETVRSLIWTFGRVARRLCQVDGGLSPMTFCHHDEPAMSDAGCRVICFSLHHVQPVCRCLYSPWLLNLPPPLV